jgi:23S rRNA pseudouridine2605 synthase
MAHGASPRHVRRPRPKRGQRPLASSETAEPDREGSDPEGTVSKARRSVGVGSESGGRVRLQKLLANAGFGSRRDVERFVVEERVTINGRVATLGQSADPTRDDIRVDGERLARDKPAYWILNKPRGVVTTLRDEAGRRTVVDLLPRKAGRLFPVGRLDRETSGLLLMTNDGDLAHALLHPSLGNEREYHVQVKGRVSDATVARLERGVSLEEGRTAPARVSGVRFDPESATTTLDLTLVEGRKRQIRRSLLFLGHPVRRLSRVRMGPLRLGRLATGDARPLRAEERRRLLAHVEQLRAGEAPAERGLAGRAGAAKRRATPSRGRSQAAGPESSKSGRSAGGTSAARRAASKGDSAKTTRSSPRKPARSQTTAEPRTKRPAKKAAAATGARRAGGARKSTGDRRGPGPKGPSTQRKPRSRKGTRR